MNSNDFPPIRTAPADLYDRLHGVDDRLNELRREVTEIRREYGQLRAHPSELAVDNLGEPVDPVVTTDAVLHGLEMTASELDCAQQQLAVARARHATRLKLTEQAAADLETRRGQRRIERTR